MLLTVIGILLLRAIMHPAWYSRRDSSSSSLSLLYLRAQHPSWPALQCDATAGSLPRVKPAMGSKGGR